MIKWWKEIETRQGYGTGLVGVRGCVPWPTGHSLVTLFSLSGSVKNRPLHYILVRSQTYYPKHILAYKSRKTYVAEPPNLMPHKSACLSLDTKHSRENTKLHSSVRHTPGENPKNPHFYIRITNKRIKLTSLVIISYITFNTTSEYNIYYYNSKM